MTCKIRNYRLLPNPKNHCSPIKKMDVVNHIIYDETYYFPIKFQKAVLEDIKSVTTIFSKREDQEKAMNALLPLWKERYGLLKTKPLFPKENLGVLIGDPLFNFY